MPRAETGEWKRVVTCDEVFAAMPAGEPVSTTEMADRIDWSPSVVYNRLEEMADADRIEKKKFNERQVVWMRPGEGA